MTLSPPRRELRDATEHRWVSAGYSVLDSIKPVEASYVALTVRGATRKAACRELGISEPTGQRIEDEAWWLAACREERENWLGDRQSAFKPLLPDAMERIRTDIRSERPEGSAQARFVAEMVFGKAMQQVQTDNRHQHSVPALEDLVDLFQKARKQVDNPSSRAIEGRVSLNNEPESATKAQSEP